jgi:hypothetical protein
VLLQWKINPLKLGGNCIPSGLTICNAAFCNYGFRMILSVNSDFFLKQHLAIVFLISPVIQVLVLVIQILSVFTKPPPPPAPAGHRQQMASRYVCHAAGSREVRSQRRSAVICKFISQNGVVLCTVYLLAFVILWPHRHTNMTVGLTVR